MAGHCTLAQVCDYQKPFLGRDAGVGSVVRGHAGDRVIGRGPGPMRGRTVTRPPVAPTSQSAGSQASRPALADRRIRTLQCKACRLGNRRSSRLGNLRYAGATAPGAVPSCAAAAREGGGARGCKSHPSSWTVRDGTARCLSARKARRGVSSPGTEPLGLNEDESQPISPARKKSRSRRVPGAGTKAAADSADDRQPLSSPAGSAWQARRQGTPQIKRGDPRR